MANIETTAELNKKNSKMAGVYLIKNRINNRIYIGSTVYLAKRKNEHFNLLRKGTHYNAYLQNDFNKCGESFFSFEVLQLESEDTKRFLIERSYLIKYHDNMKTCYNIIRDTSNFLSEAFIKSRWHNRPEQRKKATAKKISEKLAKKFSIKDPNDKKYRVKGLVRFCRTYDLSPSAISLLLHGKINQHKGWVRINFDRKKLRPPSPSTVGTYCLVNPNNEKTKIVNLTRFCRENSLDRTGMSKLLNGKIDLYKGWSRPWADRTRLFEEKARKKEASIKKRYKVYTFFSPQGEKIIVSNLRNFCQKENLSYHQMNKVFHRQRKQHKNWVTGS